MTTADPSRAVPDEYASVDKWTTASQFHAFVAQWLDKNEPTVAVRAQAAFFRHLGFSVPYVPEPIPEVFRCSDCPRRFFSEHGRTLHRVRTHPASKAALSVSSAEDRRRARGAANR